MIEIGLCLLERAFLDLHIRFRLMQRRPSPDRDRLARNFASRPASCVRFALSLRQFERGLRIGQIAFAPG